MSIDDRIAADQPKTFKFTAENEKEIKRIIAKYPKTVRPARLCLC